MLLMSLSGFVFFQDNLFHPKYTGEDLTCTVKNLKRSTQYKFRVSQSFWYLNCLKKKLFHVLPIYHFKRTPEVKKVFKFPSLYVLRYHLQNAHHILILKPSFERESCCPVL